MIYFTKKESIFIPNEGESNPINYNELLRLLGKGVNPKEYDVTFKVDFNEIRSTAIRKLHNLDGHSIVIGDDIIYIFSSGQWKSLKTGEPTYWGKKVGSMNVKFDKILDISIDFRNIKTGATLEHISTSIPLATGPVLNFIHKNGFFINIFFKGVMSKRSIPRTHNFIRIKRTINNKKFECGRENYDEILIGLAPNIPKIAELIDSLRSTKKEIQEQDLSISVTI